MTMTQGKTGIFTGLQKTREALRRSFLSLFGGGVPRNLSEILDRFEEALLLSDVSPSICVALLDRVREQRQGKPEGEGAFDECRSLLHAEMESTLRDSTPSQNGWPETTPAVFFFVGSHGDGKTTTVGRMAHRFRSEGRSVLLAGSDTHRAAAGEQVAIWAERTGSDLVVQQEGADAAAVRGGIALSIHSDLGIPISYVGVGEEPADLIEFDPGQYVQALLAAIPRQDEVGGGLRS